MPAHSLVRAALRRTALLALTAGSVLLVACGGGGGGDASTASAFRQTNFPPSASLAGQCTPETEKQWVRSYLHESYLWYDEIQDVDPAQYSTVASYFDALLVRTPTQVSSAKDQFSYVQASALGGLQPTTQAGIPPLGTDPVASGKVITSASGRKVGYILFNGHPQGAQDRMIGVFDGLRSAGVQELVLDMRYNPGGYIYVARTVASMITGPGASGQVFASLRYSDKRSAENGDAFLFTHKVVAPAEPVFPLGHVLPQLSLPKVYVLTSEWTCSASETIINSLRGIGVQVVLIGANPTCGKPYGFQPKSNCGLTFSAIEFQMYNAQGFGDYAGGFSPNCKVAENANTAWLSMGLNSGALGSTTEPLLAAALQHIESGACPAGTAMATGIQINTPSRGPVPFGPPGWSGSQLAP